MMIDVKNLQQKGFLKASGWNEKLTLYMQKVIPDFELFVRVDCIRFPEWKPEYIVFSGVGTV